MEAADVIIVASGTATLEAALLKKPMVITYRMSDLSWKILKRMRLQPYVGLPNIWQASLWCQSCCRMMRPLKNLLKHRLN